MSRLHIRPPSPAIVISTLALVVAASGTAIAAGKLVNGDRLIKKNTLSANRLRKHSVTATQINLGKLGKVPQAHSADLAGHATTADGATHAIDATNAANAGNAITVGGETVSKIFAKFPPNTATTPIYNRDGLTIDAGCGSGGVPVLTVDGSVTAEMHAQGSSGTSPWGTNASGFSGPVDITGGHNDGAGSLSYTDTNGQVVTVTYGFDNNPSFGGTYTGCSYEGTAISSN